MIFLVLACTGPTEDPLPGSGTFSGLTYNVAGLPQGISGSEPEVNMPQISPLLNGYDLVLAQEDFSYHEQLAADAEHPHQSIPKEPTDAPVNDGLNRFSEFPFEPVERTRWTDCFGVIDNASDCLAEKGFSIARTTLAEGIEIPVVNLHAEASSAPEDIAARRANFEQLADALSVYDGPLLVAGDTNLRRTRPDDLEIYDAFLDATGLIDACDALGCTDDRIDRLFYRSGDAWTLEPMNWRVGEEFVTADGEDLSDHLAVAVDWTWTREP